MKYFLPLLCIFFSSLLSAEALDYAEFKKKIGSGQNKIDYSKTLIKHDEIHKLITEKAELRSRQSWLDDGSLNNKKKQSHNDANHKNDKITNEDSINTDKKSEETPSKSNTSNADQLKDNIDKLKQEIQQLKAKTNNSEKTEKNTIVRPVSTGQKYVYIPPSLNTNSESSNSSSAYVSAPKQSIYFGIPIGTQIPVRLEKGVTNVQPGYLQFKTTQDTLGEKQILPRDSTIFCNPESTSGSPRIYAVAIKGITFESNIEFSIRGNIFSEDNNAGLIAEVINDGRAINRAMSAGVASLTQGAIGLIPTEGVMSNAGTSAARLALNEKKDENRARNGTANYVLKAAPQNATLQIEATF